MLAPFKYDPFGRRIEKISPTTTSIFVYDGDNLVETTDASGSEVASYAQTRNSDEPPAMGPRFPQRLATFLQCWLAPACARSTFSGRGFRKIKPFTSNRPPGKNQCR